MAIITGTTGNDTITSAGTSAGVTGGAATTAADSINGAAGDDSIDGAAGNDTLLGGLGNDTLTGSTGVDSVDGGDGADLLIGTGDGNDVMLGGAGTDTLDFSGLATGLSLNQSGDNLGTVTIGSRVVTFSTIEQLVLSTGNDSALGSGFADHIDGNNGNDSINGNGGNDTILGGAGDDTLLGNTGSDSVDGGDGNDIIVAKVDFVNDTINGGNDFDMADYSGVGVSMNVVVGALGGATATMGGEVDTLTGIELYHLGTGFDNFVGNDGSQQVRGHTGNDSMSGGAGDDVFYIAAGDGADTIDGGADNDAIVALSNDVSVQWTRTTGVEVFDANGFTNFRIIGSSGGNLMDLSAATLNGIDRLDGGGGNDTIIGNGDDNKIVGGQGNDSLDGGSGNDTFLVQSTGGADTIIGGTGTDTVAAMTHNATVNWASTSGIEVWSSNGFGNFRILGSSGNDAMDFSLATLTSVGRIEGGNGNDTITGNSISNRLVGGAGNDSLVGGGGNDVFYQQQNGGNDTIDGGTGTADTVAALNASAYVSWATTTGIEVFDGGTYANFRIVGTSAGEAMDLSALTLTNVERIDGGSGNDSILGNAADNRIAGGAGNDILLGGDGNDTFLMDTSSGIDAIDGGNGTADTILALSGNTFINWTQVTGVEAINGGSFANVVVNGGAANDTLDFTGVTMTGVAYIDGGAGNDTITGTAGDDKILGGSGADVMTGALGADIFTFGNVSQSTPAASDHITDFAAGDIIALGNVDANAITVGTQQFLWIGSAAFSGAAGELRAYDDGLGHTVIEGNVNNNTVADFTIVLDNGYAIGSGDFTGIIV